MSERSAVRTDLLIVASIYISATVLYASMGVRFDASTFPSYMQFIDRDLLEQHLLESLWYYHGNPPSLNFLAGIGLKLAGVHAPLFFSCVFHLFGALTVWSVFALTLRLTGSRAAAAIATAVLAFSPQFTLYQNWLMYEFLSAAMLTFSAYALHEYVQSRRTTWVIAFFATLALLLLTRSLFHLAWMVLVTALLVFQLPQHRRRVMTIALVPIAVVALWYGKNAYLVGTFGASSWMGLGLNNITTLMVTKDELVPRVQDGTLTKWALVSRYEDAPLLFQANLQPPTGVPVLDRDRKSDGSFNYNFRDIPDISRAYTADAVTVARRWPFSYVIGLVVANRLYFSPTSMNEYFAAPNREAVRPIEKIYNMASGAHAQTRAMASPHFGLTSQYQMEVNTSPLMICAWWIVLGYGYVQARIGVRARSAGDQPRALTIGFIVLTAVYLYVVSTFLEVNENFRYRFNIEPLMIVMGAVALTGLARTVRERRRRGSVPQ